MRRFPWTAAGPAIATAILLATTFPAAGQPRLDASETALQEAPAEEAAPRPGKWAQPLVRKGLPNLHRVDAKLYRGAQPSSVGFQGLRDLGVRTVVNLRKFHTDKPLMRGVRLGYEEISMPAWSVAEEDVVAFLRIATDPRRQPVFVHCQHGADRTGTMVAAYRMVVQGWTVEDALAEMTEGGFGYHAVWKNLPELLRALDVARIREALAAPL